MSLVSVFDERGQLVGSSRQCPPPPLSVADREAFRVPQSGVATLHVAAPAPNRFDGLWSFYVALRLPGPGGRFLGAATVGLDCAEFARFYASAARTPETPAGDRAAMLVRATDARVLARAPANEAWLGRVLPMQASETLLVERAEVPGQALFVQVQATEAAALAGWQRQARVMGGFVALALLLLAGGFSLLATAVQRRETELRQTQRLRLAAEAASQAKTEFLANIHHEVRTPLNGILGCAELLRQAELPAAAAAQVHTLQRSGLRLKALLDDLLDYARLEAGELRLQAAAFDPAAQLRALAEACAPLAAAKGLVLELQIDPGLPSAVQGDGERIHQVLSQLVDNAIKFTRRGSVTLRLAREGECLRWQVQDTGVGVPRALQARLFEAFVQADGTARRHAEGTGLGLALAQRLVQLMGGRIGLHSRPGEGSCFWFALPLPGTEQAPAPQAAAAPPRAPACWWWKTMRSTPWWPTHNCRNWAAPRWWRPTARVRCACCATSSSTSCSWTACCPA